MDRTILLLAMLVCAPLAFPFVDTALPATLNVSVNTNVQNQGFSPSTQTITSGNSADFSLVLESVGNTVTATSASAYIHYSNGLPADSFSYANTTLAGGEIITLVKSWASAGFPPGSYTAYANATYNGTATSTKNFTFSIVAQQGGGGGGGGGSGGTGGGGGGGGSGSAGASGTPPQVDISFGGMVGALKVLTYPVIKEILAGQNSLLYVLLENPTAEIITATLTPSGQGAGLASPIEISLAPFEKKTAIMPIHAQPDAQAGYYYMSLDLGQNQSAASVPVIFKVISSKNSLVTASREIIINPDGKMLTVRLTVQNNADEIAEHVQIYEKLPAQARYRKQEIEFSRVPNDIADDGTVRWDIEGLPPRQSREIAYTLPQADYDFSELAAWGVEQLSIIKKSGEGTILITDIRMPALSPGEMASATMKLFNSGAVNEKVDASILGPVGWQITPSSFTFLIASREAAEVNFEVALPDGTEKGTYAITIMLDYGQGSSEKTVFAVVQETPIAMLQAQGGTALRELLLGWANRNIAAIIFILAFALAALIVLRAGYKKVREPQYSAERADTLRKIKDIVDGRYKRNKR